MATRRTIEFLDGQNIKYTIIHHSPAFTAQEVAATSHIPGRSMAKTVVVEIDDALALAVVPATRDVDMSLLRSVAEARYASLADPTDFATRFEGCQLGMMPPLGNLFGMRTYADSDLAKEENIAFNAGSHSDVVVMRFADYRRIAHPKLAPISVPIGAVTAERFAGFRA
jgi:Ala-tRNA(Pro) deacylase